jgi:hypothetical protein
MTQHSQVGAGELQPLGVLTRASVLLILVGGN